MKRLILIILLLPIIANSQLTKSEIYNHNITKDGDTILVIRTPGDFWYGAYGDIGYSMFSGDFYFPEKIISGVTTYKDLRKYKDGSYFPNFSLGFNGEYFSPLWNWGIGIKLGIFDFIKNNTSQNIGDSLKREYIAETKYGYYSITPYLKFSFTTEKDSFWEGLYTYLGVSVGIPQSSKTVYKRAFSNPVRIEETYNYEMQKQLMRFAIEACIGWDIFDANVEKGARTIVSPFISFNYGTKMTEDFGSSQQALEIKGGVSLRLGIDRKNKDTLKYVPKEHKQLVIPTIEPSILTTVDLKSQQFEAQDIEPIFIEPEVVVEDIPKLPDPSVEYSLSIEKKAQKPEMSFNKKYIVTYTKSETDVELSKSGKDFFEDLAGFMKKNTGCIIIIEGYNDDRGGSIRENQRLSILRAENAKQELVNRGISAGRIVSSGKGAIKNIASNETPAGRAKNRRIEIIIKQNSPPKY